ncbi:SLC5 family protein [Blastopirellula marina]|uniref:Sodium-glucose/galactose cotransporter n=1 Tax=Blastopirellula marina DSM 3645 TaxID=314230 RepID=A3ZSJ2_9BACT|nr:sodium/solute symporter [Blastopirellula marina]EAQ80652.1 sodium-glucose/galactose cotransporter [Blastopirellula marina DSM 3645]
MPSFSLDFWDYVVFAGFFLALGMIGFWAGRGEQASSQDYFLAGRKLPWYVVGGSFIASNISSEHFIGMIGSAVVFGVCVSLMEWANVVTFSLLIWFFIPFLLATKVFTIPEFLEKRFSLSIRQMFAFVTVLSNVVAFLATVLYGGGLALQSLFGWSLWFSIITLGIVAGVWAIYGGLSSVAWTDLFTVVIMILGGVLVSVLGLQALSGDEGSLWDGFTLMLERNQEKEGQWAEAVNRHLAHLTNDDSYNRLSLYQGVTHPITPTISLIPLLLSVGVWYNVLNQFMIQRVLGAKDEYHARMGIVLAGWVKVFFPLISVLPGMVLFALHPEIMLRPWDEVKPAADQGYVNLIQTLIPAGLRGLLLAALFGAIQSTINSVLNSTSTILTLDIYKRLLAPEASDKQLVRVGVISSVVVLAIAIILGGFVGEIGGSLFEYAQSLYAFFAPPFAAVFLLGILWRRINSAGALAAICVGFASGILMKLYLHFDPSAPAWLSPYWNQAAINWLLCVAVCIGVSLTTSPPRADQITDQLTFNWSRLNLFNNLGDHWYTSVVTWWGLFVVVMAALFITFSGVVF